MLLLYIQMVMMSILYYIFSEISLISNEISKCGGIMEYFCPIMSREGHNLVSLCIKLENSNIELIKSSITKLNIIIESCYKNPH